MVRTGRRAKEEVGLALVAELAVLKVRQLLPRGSSQLQYVREIGTGISEASKRVSTFSP